MAGKRVSKSVKKSGNHNYIDKDGLVHNDWIGDQTTETVKKSYIELTEIYIKLRKEGRPTIVLADITKLGKVTAGARREGFHLMRDSDCDWVAVYGNYFLFKGLVEALIVATGMGFKIKFFNGKDKALEWLEGKLQISETSSPW